MRIKASLIPCKIVAFYGDLLASGRSLLTIIIQIKNDLIVMRLHFRYHVIFGSKIKRLNKDCKYCQDWLTMTDKRISKRNISYSVFALVSLLIIVIIVVLSTSIERIYIDYYSVYASPPP